MSGTQYHPDGALVGELNARSREIAIYFSKTLTLKQLFQFKYTQKDTFNNERFSEFVKKDKLLIINALIVFRLSCIDYVYLFSPEKVDFILNEYIHAYEDFLSLSQRNYLDFEQELKANYPRAVQWINLIESQARINQRFADNNKHWVI